MGVAPQKEKSLPRLRGLWLSVATGGIVDGMCLRRIGSHERSHLLQLLLLLGIEVLQQLVGKWECSGFEQRRERYVSRAKESQ